MDTNRNGIYGSNVATPGGAEFEAATLHVPVGESYATHVHSHEPLDSLSERSGVRGKLENLKAEGLSKVHELQRAMSDRGSAMKSNVSRSVALMKSNVTRTVDTAKSSLRDGTTTRYAEVQTSMRSNPMKWAGIAAGSGFALGLLSRIVQWRNKQHHAMPNLIVIERSC